MSASNHQDDRPLGRINTPSARAIGMGLMLIPCISSVSKYLNSHLLIELPAWYISSFVIEIGPFKCRSGMNYVIAGFLENWSLGFLGCSRVRIELIMIYVSRRKDLYCSSVSSVRTCFYIRHYATCCDRKEKMRNFAKLFIASPPRR